MHTGIIMKIVNSSEQARQGLPCNLFCPYFNYFFNSRSVVDAISVLISG